MIRDHGTTQQALSEANDEVANLRLLVIQLTNDNAGLNEMVRDGNEEIKSLTIERDEAVAEIAADSGRELDDWARR